MVKIKSSEVWRSGISSLDPSAAAVVLVKAKSNEAWSSSSCKKTHCISSTGVVKSSDAYMSDDITMNTTAAAAVMAGYVFISLSAANMLFLLHVVSTVYLT